MKRTAFVVTALALALLLASCILKSENPLSNPHDFPADSRLEGIWTAHNQGYLYFIPIDDSVMEVDLVEYYYTRYPTDRPRIEWERYRVFRTEIEGAEYLNVKPIAGAAVGKPVQEREYPGYIIVKYQISDDGLLTIWSGSEDTVRRGIENGIVAGTGSKIADNSASLRDYIRYAEGLFTVKIGTFRKIRSKIPGAK